MLSSFPICYETTGDPARLRGHEATGSRATGSRLELRMTLL